MIDVAFGKDHQRVRAGPQDFDRRLERRQVGPFAVDAEAAVPLQHELLEPLAHREDLPGGEEVERRSDAMGGLDQHVGVVVERMVRRDQHARSAVQRLLDVLDSGHVHLDDLLSLAQRRG